MDEKWLLELDSSYTEKSTESLYPIYFGASCAFFALQLLSGSDMQDERWSRVCEKMLQGSAHLLGLLVWRIQSEGANGRNNELLLKLEAAEREIEELKKTRQEDAKANEKVVGIFAGQEQSWFNERRKLRQKIGALINELRVFEKKRSEAISGLNEKVKETELLVQSKDKILAEEEQKRSELEAKLREAENVVEELREAAKRVAQEHSMEIGKHKTAFIELVSNHRQLESYMGRALKQVEAAKEEVSLVSKQKEESMMMVQRLSCEMVKMHNETEQKDKILSAMVRKSKFDAMEKQLLLKELKLCKAKKKQVEVETGKLRAVSESTRERHSFRSLLARHASSRSHSSDVGREHDDPEFRKEESPVYAPEATTNDQFDETDANRVEGWVQMEADKYATIVEQRHHQEINAFVEQMRLKDEKLEACHWKLLSMELETKRLNHDLSQLRHDSAKLEALLAERDEELNSLKDQVKLLNCSTTNMSSSLTGPWLDKCPVWSEVKIIKQKPGQRQQECETEKEDEVHCVNNCEEVVLAVQSPGKEFEEENDDVANLSPVREVASPVAKEKSPWRMDFNALGVSFKIKRLKQQLLLVERLAGKQETGEEVENKDNGRFGVKGFVLLMSLLNKQVGRYQTLQGKTDDLCKRLHGNEPDLHQGEAITTSRTKSETRTLEHYLEETFQLQRYIVATGQKMMEIQTKIASEFVDEGLDKSATFDPKRFGDGIRSLFQEVQRGLEVRIARIIGDLEGTLACEGMVHLRR